MRFLKQLTETPGVPGREERVRDLIKRQTRDLFDSQTTDAMGNLICRLKPGRGGRSRGDAKKVMIACHIDEIGFYVRAIDDDGRLRIHAAGGFDTRNLFARRVLVQGRKDIVGILNPSGPPIHVASAEDRKKVPELKEFFVDLCRPKRQVDRLVQIGDPVTLIQSFEEIGDMVTGKCLDNRVASWVAISALRRVRQKSKYDIYYVATVQEEVGCRGAMTSAYRLDADVGIALDTTLACDTPGIDKHEAITRLGDGVAIKIMDAGSISHRGLVDEFIKVAKAKRIKHQLEVLPLGATDAATVQRAGAGRRTLTLSIPTRYIHTVTETVHKKDLDAAVNLLAAWLTT